MRNKDKHLNYYEVRDLSYNDGLNASIFVRNKYDNDKEDWEVTLYVSLWVNVITSREDSWYTVNNTRCFRYNRGRFFDVFNESELSDEYQENFDDIKELTKDIYEELNLSNLPMDKFFDYIVNQCLSILLGFKEYDETEIEWDYDWEDDDEDDWSDVYNDDDNE